MSSVPVFPSPLLYSYFPSVIAFCAETSIKRADELTVWKYAAAHLAFKDPLIILFIVVQLSHSSYTKMFFLLLFFYMDSR